MKVLGMCFNPKVLAGLALVGLAVWVYAPGALLAVLPFLVLALCPLSMLFMGRMMMSGSGSQRASQDPAAKLAALEQERRQLQLEIARTRSQASAEQAFEALPAPSRPQP